MCGISGFLSPRGTLRELASRQRDRLAHRGPDGAGLWLSPEGDVALGHRRLSIIDLSEAAAQPFVSVDGRYALVFNGEIYDHLDHRRRLLAAGVAFRSGSDTELLLHLLMKEGVSALSKLAGQWALALWDTQERTLLLVRDRVGEKPLYWARIGQDFGFGSELKALTIHPDWQPELDFRAMVDVLSLGFVVPPKTIYTRASQLPPGSWMRVRFPVGAPPEPGPVERYWRFDPLPEARADFDEEIRDTLLRVTSQMTVSDVPVGAFLSGGVDSSTVVAALARGGHRLGAHTIGFREDRWDETRYARTVAQAYGVPHEVTTLDAESALDQFGPLLAHYDEPFADSSALPTRVLCGATRAGATVALSGDGADEVFGGYRRYQRWARRARIRNSGWRRGTLRAASAFLDLLPERRTRTLRQYAGSEAAALADMFSVIGTRPQLQRLCRGPLLRALNEYGPHEVVREHLSPVSSELPPIERMRALDLALTLGAGILTKVDRASMAVALEVRPVFTHRDVLALAARIPAVALADEGRAKIPLRSAMAPWFEPGFLERKKQGFALPLPTWIREQRGPFRGLSELPHLRDWIDRRSFTELLRAQRDGRDDLTSLVFALVHLDRWVGHWLDSGTPHAS